MTPEIFNESIQQEGVVLVDFYSDNCGPCRILAPVLDQLENVTVVKVNTVESRDLAAEHNISAVPTLEFYKNGVLVESVLGFHTKEALQSKIDVINQQ